MEGSAFGNKIKVTTTGGSHDKTMSVSIEGLPGGFIIDKSALTAYINRRKPVDIYGGTARHEDDMYKVIKGLENDKTIDNTPLVLEFENNNTRSSDYEAYKNLYRPGHADFTYDMKYDEIPIGGGRASGRETLTRVAAGGVIAQYLKEKYGITAESMIDSIGSIPSFDGKINDEQIALLKDMHEKGDSVGGVINCIIHGVPSGIGDPVFNKLDAALSYAIMSIGAVKGLSFGMGFEMAYNTGSVTNDEFIGIDNKRLISQNNYHGGILGGISTGEDIVIHVAVKPTPSISIPQHTIDRDGNPAIIEIKGRHDTCIATRIGVVIESMALLTIANFL
ncbi:MAG: chorismate synthase [Lachnospiraceae bacterium]|nr:chorismate synthase [Lachnospiraceae bacterium]